MTQTVFVTGASGFIAKHILVKLLNAGFDVVGSVRRLDRVDEICNAVRPHLNGPVDLSAKLRFVALDLAKDDGWAAALQGADVLMHTASPFPMSQPKDEDDIVRPAVDGALRALKAAQAAGIKRVVMTSSTVSIMSKDLAPGQTEFTEADWSDTNHPTINPYGKSKTLAERAAWDFITNHAPDMELTVINPGFVLGTPLDKHFGTSIKVIKRLLDATDPMLPQFGFPIVDVSDVAEMHVRALTHDDTAGKRFIAANGFLWFYEVAEILKAAHPDRKIITRRAPNFVVRILSWFDKSIKTIVPILGRAEGVSNARAREVMQMEFTSPEDAVRASGAYLIDNGLV